MHARWRRDQDEEVLVAARAHARQLFPVLIVAMVLAAAAGFAAAALDPPWRGIIALAAAAGWAVASTPRVARWSTTRHIVTSRRLMLRTGVLRRRKHEVPLRNVHEVYLERSLLQRLFRCADIVVESDDEPLRLHDVVDPDDVRSTIIVASELASVGAATDGTSDTPHGRDPLDTLSALADLRERGHLDDEEFAHYKRRLVDGHMDDRPFR